MGGITRGGHGIGLSSCTDFVAASFGTPPQNAIGEKYVGAKVVDDTYYTWFHWPIYHANSDDFELDDRYCEHHH